MLATCTHQHMYKIAGPCFTSFTARVTAAHFFDRAHMRMRPEPEPESPPDAHPPRTGGRGAAQARAHAFMRHVGLGMYVALVL